MSSSTKGEQRATSGTVAPSIDHIFCSHRYHAALEMLGERTEQVEELRADIADVKEMYRSQIVELVQKIDLLSKS